MTILLEPLAPTEAIRALELRGKNLVPSFDWRDVYAGEHAAMQTVAKSAGFDILTDIQDGLVAALKEGKTGREFAAGLKPLLQAKGWWGRQDVVDPLTGEFVNAQLGSIRRLATIFDANMRVSYAVGHWAQFERAKSSRPWLRYVAVLDGRARPEHAARHNLCLRIDDPYWDKWAPPCGWGCRCTLQSLSDRDVERMRGELKFEPPPDIYRVWINGRTGEEVDIPVGIDPGWDYNPGKAGHRALAYATKLAAAPPDLAAAAVEDPDFPVAKLTDEFAAWFDRAAAGGRVDRSSFPIGALGQRTLDWLDREGKAKPATGAITITQQVVQHMDRDTKRAVGKAVPTGMLRQLPEMIRNPRAVLWDKERPALLYVFDVAGADRLGKLVVQVDFQERRKLPTGERATVITNAARSATLVPLATLRDGSKYDLVDGSL